MKVCWVRKSVQHPFVQQLVQHHNQLPRLQHQHEQTIQHWEQQQCRHQHHHNSNRRLQWHQQAVVQQALTPHQALIPQQALTAQQAIIPQQQQDPNLAIQTTDISVHGCIEAGTRAALRSRQTSRRPSRTRGTTPGPGTGAQRSFFDACLDIESRHQTQM